MPIAIIYHLGMIPNTKVGFTPRIVLYDKQELGFEHFHLSNECFLSEICQKINTDGYIYYLFKEKMSFIKKLTTKLIGKLLFFILFVNSIDGN